MAGPHAFRASRRRRAACLSGEGQDIVSPCSADSAGFDVKGRDFSSQVSIPFRRSLAACLFLVLCVILTAHAAGPQNPDFSRPDPVIDLTGTLSPYHASAASDNDSSRWYLTTVANRAVRPVTRILLAEQPADAALRILPRRGRASVRQVAASDADVTVENAHAYGRYAFRVTIPPATSTALAIRIANGEATPRVLAWSESAIAAHKAQTEIVFAAIAGLIAASLAIMAGVAVMTGHATPRWASAVLLGLLLVQLGFAGMFDAT